jgi:hypothetical protein
LTDATRQVLANGLKLLGVTAPEYMSKLDSPEDELDDSGENERTIP